MITAGIRRYRELQLMAFRMKEKGQLAERREIVRRMNETWLRLTADEQAAIRTGSNEPKACCGG